MMWCQEKSKVETVPGFWWTPIHLPPLHPRHVIPALVFAPPSPRVTKGRGCPFSSTGTRTGAPSPPAVTDAEVPVPAPAQTTCCVPGLTHCVNVDFSQQQKL